MGRGVGCGTNAPCHETLTFLSPAAAEKSTATPAAGTAASDLAPAAQFKPGGAGGAVQGPMTKYKLVFLGARDALPVALTLTVRR